jgi:hypothetical protein
MAIDTLAFAKYLEDHGVPRAQAEAHAEAANRYLFPELATKGDLAAARQNLGNEIRTVKRDLTVRMVGIVGAFDALLFALLHFAK